MADRSVEDLLREEYFDLLPAISRVTEHLATEVRYHTLSIANSLGRHERLVVTSRVKECGSALEALRRRQEGKTFDQQQPDVYSLTSLRDPAGVRVLGSPRTRLKEVDELLREQFPAWASDPVRDENKNILAQKYNGYCPAASVAIRGEYQVVSMLTGLFWEIEHSAIYKPTPSLKGIARDLGMQQRSGEVLRALRAFEEEFEGFVLRGRDAD